MFEQKLKHVNGYREIVYGFIVAGTQLKGSGKYYYIFRVLPSTSSIHLVCLWDHPEKQPVRDWQLNPHELCTLVSINVRIEDGEDHLGIVRI